MKYELKQIEDFGVVISNDEVKEGDWFIHKTNADESIHKCISRPVKLHVIGDNNISYYLGYCKKIIATIGKQISIKSDCDCGATSFEGCSQCLETLPMFELPNQEDVEELAKEYAALQYPINMYSVEVGMPHRGTAFRGFIEGYKVAQSKKWSDSDMIKAYISGTNSGVTFQSICEDDFEDAEEYSKSELEDFEKSLQKKQFPIAVDLTEDLKVIKWYYE